VVEGRRTPHVACWPFRYEFWRGKTRGHSRGPKHSLPIRRIRGAYYSRPGWNVTAFLTQPVKDSGHIDSEDHSTTFWGIYATHYFDAPHTLGLDLYYLGIHREDGKYASGSGDEHRHTLGAREFGAWNHWDLEGEQVLQVGSFGNETILAWTAAINAGYTWDTTWSPRLGLKAGATSGDNNPNDGRLGTFDALYFKSGYFNDASLNSGLRIS